MKKQTRNIEVHINEEDIGKLPEKEFRMIVKMIKNLENKMEKMQQESINKDLGELKNKHPEKNKQTKMHTNLTLYEAYTNHWTNLRRAETKRKKEFNLEAWEKETSNTISKKIIIIMKR